MIRDGMDYLVSELALMTESGTEYTEDQLQAYLDKTQMQLRNVSLVATPTYTSGSTVFTIYELPNFMGEWFELPQDNTVNDAFYLTDSSYNVVLFGSGDAQCVFDQNLKRIVFNDNTNGKYYLLTVTIYDLYSAAAKVWELKLSKRTPYVNIKIDNHTFNLKDEYDHCLERYNHFRSLSLKAGRGRFVRYDQGVGYYVYSPAVRGFMPVSES